MNAALHQQRRAQHFHACGVLDSCALGPPYVDFHEMTEGETLLFGTNVGTVTGIRIAPNGNLFVVSLANGVVYETFRRKAK